MPDFVDTFSEALAESASGSIAKFIEEETKSALTNVGIAAALASAPAEFAKTAAEHLLGPLLKVFLKIIDPTQRKLDGIREDLAIVMAEPLQTGTSLANSALSVKVITESDRKLRDQHFYAALEALEKAYFYASSPKVKGDIRIRIRLTQALIAKALDARGNVEWYLSEFITTLKERKTLAEKDYDEAAKSLERAESDRIGPGRATLSYMRGHLLRQLGDIPGRWSYPPVGTPLERKVAKMRSDWRRERDGILKSTEPPSEEDVKLLRSNADAARNRLQKLQAFATFWEIQ